MQVGMPMFGAVTKEIEASLKRQLSQFRDQKTVVRKRLAPVSDVIKTTEGFRLENGTEYPWWLEREKKPPTTENRDIVDGQVIEAYLQSPLVENPEYDSSWYMKYFYLKGQFP